MKNAAFFLLLMLGTLFVSCTKDELDIPLETGHGLTTADSRTIGSSREDISRPEGSGCTNFPTGVNYVVVKMALAGGGLETYCFTESELLSLADQSADKAGYQNRIQQAFVSPNVSSPQTAYDLGRMLAEVYKFPSNHIPDCFSISVCGRKGYPYAPPRSKPTGSEFEPAPAESTLPGDLDLFTLRQSRPGGGGGMILEPGFSGFRLLNTCTGELKTVAFPQDLNALHQLMLDAGLQPSDANIAVKQIMNGKWDARRVWNFFQFHLVPNHPAVKALYQNDDISCWKLFQAGIGIFAADNSILSFYFLQGKGEMPAGLPN